MKDKKLLIIICLCVVIVILAYVCVMFTPLLDDVWKILFFGIVIGVIPGFMLGIKFKGLSIRIEDKEGKRF